jgi:hypothetical protein
LINRDEDGVIVSADSVADVTQAMAQIEKALECAVKDGLEDMSNEDKEDIIAQMNDLKILITLVTPDMQKSAKPTELISFLRQIIKVKSAAEEFKKLGEAMGKI